MRTAMMPTVCVGDPCSSCAWNGPPGSRARLGERSHLLHGSSTVGPQRPLSAHQALVDHFIACDPAPPAAIVLDVDHADDPTYGQQEFTFYNHYYKNHCYLPLFIFEGTSHALVMAYLRPGTRPTGAENAMILSRLLSHLRRHWPQTHILVRGDSHFRHTRGDRGHCPPAPDRLRLRLGGTPSCSARQPP